MIPGRSKFSEKQHYISLRSTAFFIVSVSNRILLLMRLQQQQNHNHKKCLLWHCSVADTDLSLSSNLYLRKYHSQGQAGLTSAASFTLFLKS